MYKYRVEFYGSIEELLKRSRFLMNATVCRGLTVEKDLRKLTWKEGKFNLSS